MIPSTDFNSKLGRTQEEMDIFFLLDRTGFNLILGISLFLKWLFPKSFYYFIFADINSENSSNLSLVPQGS